MQQLGMSPGKAARELGISIDAVYKLLYANKLEAKKVNGVWVIAPRSVADRLRRKRDDLKR